MNINKYIRVVLTITILAIISTFEFEPTFAQEKTEKNIPDKVEVDELLAKDYEYDLDSILYIKKGEKEPRIFDLNTSNLQGEFTSSEVLNQKNSDRIENYSKQDKLRVKLNELEKDPSIEYFQPVYLYTSEAWARSGEFDTPSDFDQTPSPSTGNHWYYELSNLRKLWQRQDCLNAGAGCGGSSNVTVAVIDTGLALEDRNSAWNDVGSTKFNFDQIPDMFTGGSINLFVNAGETPNNQIDDDSNGYIDDANGFNSSNFILCYYSACTTAQTSETGHPNDDGGHGTYVTGLIASLVDNASGSVSPASKVTIMPIKANFRKSNSFGTLELYYAIYYAIDNGADIINMSLAGSSPDGLLEEALQDARDAGILVVASSGNLGGAVQYPAKYNSSTVAVGAVNPDNSRSSYSNYGSDLDLVAYVGQGGASNATYQSTFRCFTSSPNCYSSTDTSRYTLFSNTDAQYRAVGTSFAAPQVAAAAAIILGNNPEMTLGELKVALVSSTNDITSYGAGKDNETGWGVIDYEKAGTQTAGSMISKYFNIYRYINNDKAWIWVGNPSETERVNVSVEVGGKSLDLFQVGPQENVPFSYSPLFDGPVKITGSDNIHVTNKSRSYNGKLNEVEAISASDFDTKFYFPIYKFMNGDGAWLWVTNPNSTSATVSVELSGVEKDNIAIPAGESSAFYYQEEYSGPLTVSSNIDVYATLKMRTNGGFEELKGISQNELSTTFYYPIYRHLNGDEAFIWIGNPSASLTTSVNVEIAGVNKGTYNVGPGSTISVVYPGLFDGPVKITSDNPIYTTLKTLTDGVTNEFAGIRASDFSPTFSYPIYRFVNGDGAWLWIGNPDNSDSANINIRIAGVDKGNYQIDPLENMAFSFPGIFTGPVSITSDISIYSTMKSRSNGSLNEFVGIDD